MRHTEFQPLSGRHQAVAARGATLFYIPAYSPDFNPIEQFFAKLKSILRKIAAYTLKGIAFTVDSLCKAIVFCLDQISRAECAAYLANSGYGQPKRETL
jgi:transposase